MTVSEGMITVAGWTGVGYIIADPATGSGAYKISGGGNGAYFLGLSVGFGISIFIVSLMQAGTSLLLLNILYTTIIVALIFVGILAALSDNPKMVLGCFFSGLLLGIDIGFIFGPPSLKDILKWQEVLIAAIIFTDTIALLDVDIMSKDECLSE